MIHELPDVTASVAAQAGAEVYRFQISAPAGMDGSPQLVSQDSDLGEVKWSETTPGAGSVIATGKGGTGHFVFEVDGAAGPGRYTMKRALVLTFVPGPSTSFDIAGEVVVAPAELDPDTTDTTTPAAPGAA